MAPFITRGQALAFAAVGCVLLSPCTIAVGVVIVKSMPESSRSKSEKNLKEQIGIYKELVRILDRLEDQSDFLIVRDELKSYLNRIKELETEFNDFEASARESAMAVHEVELETAKKRWRDTLPRPRPQPPHWPNTKSSPGREGR